MSPHDLFILAVCEGEGTRDHHSGGHYFFDLGSLRSRLSQLGILWWWETVWCRRGW